MSDYKWIQRAIVAACMDGPEHVETVELALGPGPLPDVECNHYWQALRYLARQGSYDLAQIADEMVKRHGVDAVQGLVELYGSRWESAHLSRYCEQVLEIRKHEATKALAEQLHKDKEPDYDEYIARLDQIRSIQQAEISSAADAVREMRERQDSPAASHPTGIPEMDKLLNGGNQDAQICVVGGRPGSGKTVLMMQMAMGAIAAGDRVLVVSLEMAKGELMQRLSKRLSQAQLKALPMWFIDSTSDLRAIVALCKVAHRRHRVSLIVIDYLQLLEVTGRHNGREEQVATASRAIKRLAMDLRVPVIVGSQLNRAAQGKPTLMNLRESGAIEQDASQVVLLQAPEDYGEPTGFFLAKNRNGEMGEWKMRLDGPRYQFTEVIREDVAEGWNL